MASSKRDQIIQEAEKLAARGKLDAAIKEYKRAVDQVPSDTNALNRLGDLLVRVARIPEAIEVYQRIAEHFAQDGFFLKSIAIYKKVNRLDPRRTETYERLADLYFKQGLIVEGRQQLVTLADWFLRSKQPQEAVRVYRRLVELEPSNFQARAKLVDLSVQLGDIATVASEIDTLGRSLLSRGMLDEALKLYYRALDLGPEQADFVAPCIDALVNAGRQAQAAELAKKALAATKGGLELERAAAKALAEAGEAAEARRLAEGLVAKAGDRTEIIQLYGDVMIRSADPAEAMGQLLPTVDRLLKVRDVARAATLVKKLMNAVPGDPQVLERAQKVFEQLDDADMVLNIETALADAYLREGRRNEAIPLYRRLAAVAPSNPLYAQRLAELGVAVPAPPAAHPAPAPAAPAPPPEEEVEFVDVEFGSGVGARPAPPPPVAPAPRRPPEPPEERPRRDAGLTEPSLSPTNAEELYTEAVVFAKYGLTDKAITHLQRLLALDATHERGRELLASLGGGELVEVEAPPARVPAAPLPEAAAPPAPEFPRVSPAEPAFAPFSEAIPLPPAAPGLGAHPAPVPPPIDLSLQAPALDLSSVGTPAPHPPPAPTAAVPPPRPPQHPKAAEPRPMEPRPMEPLPSFDDLVAPLPPKPPLARESRRPATGPVRLDNLEAMLGLRAPTATPPVAPPVRPAPAPAPTEPPARPHAAAPPPEVKHAPPAPPPAPEPPAAPEEPIELVEVPEVLAGPSDDQLRELDFLIQQGLLEDAAKLLGKVREAFPDHPDVATRHAMLKARGWDEERPAPVTATAAELFSEEEQFFDLAAELEKELADEEMVAEATGAGKASDVSIEDLFKEFQRGVAEQVQEEDYDTHFNLGLAYREMGLLDEAIGEFQLSTKSPDYLVESASMIGACYLDKGLPEQGAEWYQRALAAPNLPLETELGLRYELGRAHELAGNTGAALSCFSEVLAINPTFRDVVDRVSKLRSN
ncbi:MAG TPA: tetratricopeptide repeat protein [Thermoanaerobaculaceae bacterium]|nr:tetratricopeptide repeat protein [Thermoanaerobaculaceae bacterium]